MSEFAVNQRVRLTKDIWEEGEDLPPGVIAKRGESVVIRKVDSWPYALSVSHEGVLDRSFGVDPDEVEPIPT